MDAYVGAAIGFVTAAVLAMISSWLAERENIAEDVRSQRIAAYPAVWKRTSVVSRWPRTDAGREHFLRLHEDLRSWYYAGGGLYLSTRARQRYEHLQLVLEAVLSISDAKAPRHYESVMDAASYFRTGLADDLETRNRRSAFVALARRRADARARKKAAARLRSLTALAPGRATSTDKAGPPFPLHAVDPQDEKLTLPGDPTPTE